MRDLLLLSLTAYCALTALRRPVFGILAYICFSLLAPHSLTWNAARTFPHVQVIALCTIIGYMLSPESKKFPRQREVYLLLALWGMFGLSSLLAFSAEDAFVKFIYISKVFVMVFLSLFLIHSEDRVHLLLRIIALSIGFYSLKVGTFVLRTGGQGAIYGPEASFLEANNSLGMALAMNVPLLFYLSKIETVVWLRWIMKVMAVLSYPAVAGTFSRGAWLALAVVTVLFFLRSRHKVLGVMILACAVSTTSVWLPLVLSQKMEERYKTIENYEEDPSAQSRFWSWEFCTRVGLARPLSGGGFDYYSEKAYATFFPEFLYRWSGKVWSCHSMWLTVFSEHGFPGFVLWVSLLGFCLLSLRRIRSDAKLRKDSSRIVPYAEMIQTTLAGFIVSGIFLDIAYFEVYYFLIVAIVGLKESQKEQSAIVEENLFSPLLLNQPHHNSV